MPDGREWALGQCEQIAPRLLEATDVVLAEAAPRAGERLLDLGCGTGTTALAAAAIVTGVDPAERHEDPAAFRASSPYAVLVANRTS